MIWFNLGMQALTIDNKTLIRKRNTARRDEAVRQMVNHLYNEKRLRFDDVIAKVAEKFFLSETTVKEILKK